GRKLEEQGAALSLQRLAPSYELARRLGGLLQTQPVRDLLRRLERETEVRRRLRGPGGEQRRGRHPVERVVDLDGGKDAGVEAEHAGRRKLLGIERPAPRGIAEAGRSDEELGLRTVGHDHSLTAARAPGGDRWRDVGWLRGGVRHARRAGSDSSA